VNYYDDEDAAGRVYDPRILRRLGGYLRPYLKQLALVLLFGVIVAGLHIAGPLVVRYAIDNQIAEGRTDQLGMLVFAYMSVLIGAFVLDAFMAVVMTYVSQRAMMDLRLDLFAHVQKMSIAFFDRNPVGRLLTRLTNDVAALEQMLTQGVVETLINSINLVFIVIVLFVLDWRMALVMMVLVVPLAFLVQKLSVVMRGAFREQRAWLSRINAYLNENITGMSVIQLFNRQARNFRRFDDRNRELLRANQRVVFFYAVFDPIVVMFNALTTALIIWYGGSGVIDGAITLGTLVAFLAYMQRFFYPIRDLSERLTTLQQSMASCERIFGILDEPEEVTDAQDARALGRIEGKIEFRDVWFAYDEGNWVLRDVSFTIQPGEKVAIVGATGAGKSTMMSLLNRFYDVQRGAILIDGVPVSQLKQQELRRQVGLVLQDAFIFTDTVAENIRMRDHSLPLDQVYDAGRTVGADAFIRRLPEGYETVLAERGANLSTGQKQLVALARVAAFNPQIVLVMDEATASVDPETEATLQRSIQRVMEGRTSIVIAHRLNTIRHVDRILVLHQGRIVEEGTHEALLASRGAYFRLYELQYKDQDIGVT
jgi:ATP-binding cassette subfamily B protein